jgi:N6-L-threonylcarbamoyladenine synthase
MATFITDTSLENYKLPEKAPDFPLLSLTVSGGHTQLVLFNSFFDYKVLGETGDDAIGEAYDKVAKIIGLPYPGGPSIEKFAPNGDPNTYYFPKSRMENKYDFSFSGIKTAVLRTAQNAIGENHSFPSKDVAGRLSESQKANIASSFMKIATETVVDKTVQAYEEFKPTSVIIAGGVAASRELRRQLEERLPISPIYTDIKLCTDNGAMIATAGCLMMTNNLPTSDPKTLDIDPNLQM